MTRWQRGSRIAGGQTQAAVPGVETVPSEYLVDADGRDPDPALLLAPQLITVRWGSEAGVGEGEGDDLLVNPGRRRVGHPRLPALTRAQDLGLDTALYCA